MAYRSSTGELGFYDEPPRRPGGGGERWDREKFERSRRARDDQDHFHFEDHDHVGKHHHDIEIDARVDRRGPRVIERERFHERNSEHGSERGSSRGGDRFDRIRRPRTQIFDDHTPSEVANLALAPYRRKSVVEKDVQIAVKRPGRPQYLRRTSSLDTFDRRPMRRYGEKDHDEWRPPTNVPIPLPVRERRRSPSRRRIIREEEYEDVRYSEPREEYREVEVRREKSTQRRSRSKRAVSVAQSSRSSSLSSFEEIPAPKPIGKKGKTRMPKRLVKKQAVIELGYPFEEEDDFIVVRVALEKEQIDEVIRISENYKEEKTTYVYEDRQEYAPPPPPPPAFEQYQAPPPPPSVHYHVQSAPPPPASVHYAQSVRSSSPSRYGHEASFEERIEESNHISGPLTVLVPDDKKGQRIIRDRDVKDEIRQLEEERRMLKYERDTDYEFVERERREPRREVVRVEKDRKAKRPPNPKVIAAMMATLT